MWNLQDDNELDKLSREAADGYSLDQSPGSWDKLHARLNAEMPEQKRRRYLLFLLLFLVIGSGTFWLTRMNNTNGDQEVLTQNAGTKNTTSDNNAPVLSQKKPSPSSSDAQVATNEPFRQNTQGTNEKADHSSSVQASLPSNKLASDKIASVQKNEFVSSNRANPHSSQEKSNRKKGKKNAAVYVTAG